MTYLRARRALTAALILGTASGCSSSKLVNLWKDPERPRRPLANVLVVTLKRAPVARRLWEDTFKGALDDAGVRATPSYELFPAALPDTQQVADAVRKRGYDGVIVVHRLPSETHVQYVPGYATARPVHMGGRWPGVYHTYYVEVHRPGYREVQKVVRYQVDVWNTDEGGRLVWAGTTETLNPGKRGQVRREITKLIVPELAHKGVIGGP